MGDEAMRRFMKGDGDNYWDHPNGRQVEHIRQAAVLRARLPHLLDLRSEATRFTGTDLKYPWVDLVTASMMPLMYFNTLAAWYLLSLNTPRLLVEPSMKALESGSSYKRKAEHAQASRHGKSRNKKST